MTTSVPRGNPLISAVKVTLLFAATLIVPELLSVSTCTLNLYGVISNSTSLSAVSLRVPLDQYIEPFLSLSAIFTLYLPAFVALNERMLSNVTPVGKDEVTTSIVAESKSLSENAT